MLALARVQCRRAGGALRRGRCAGIGYRAVQLRQYQGGVADDGVVARERPGGVFRLHVHLDEGLAARVDELRILVGGVGRVQARADRQHQIGLADSDVGGGLPEAAEHAERELMRFREHALAGGGGGDRGREQLGKRGQLRVGAGDTHAVAGDDHRALRAGEGRGGGLHVRVVAVGSGWEVALRRIQDGPAVRAHGTAQRGAVIDHRHRTALAAECVLDRELGTLHRLHGIVRHGSVLGDPGESAARVEGAVVASAALIGRVVRERRLVGEIGQ